MSSLAIIPARGGSKRLPGKNSKPLDGKPLVLHTVDAAVNHFDRIVFTSDDDELLELVREHTDVLVNVHVNKRPEALATDTSKVIDTVNYYFDVCQDAKEGAFDAIWLLLPTCPLRTSEDIQKAKQYMLEHQADGVISITDPEFPPSLGLIERWDGFLSGLDPHHPFAAGNSRSQDQPITYRPNGAIYGMWWDSFKQHRNFYRGNIKGYYMPRERSIDIDTQLDFTIAEAVINNARSS